MKWLFYVIVFIYMFYRAVYGVKNTNSLSIEAVEYDKDKSFLLPGIRKTLSCKGASKNQKVEWIDPAGNTVKREPGNRVFVQEHFVSSIRTRTRLPALVLVFTSTSVEDSGVWTCRSGETKQTVSLCVIDPAQFVDTPTEVTVDSGRSITLTCQVRGDPEPRVEWYGNDEIIYEHEESPKYKVALKYNSQGFEGLLTIMSLEPKDSGIYTCDAVQETPFSDYCSHRESLNITLQVNHAPVFKDGNDTLIVYGIEGESVELVCSASGFPKPTFRWFKEIDDTLSEFAQDQIQILNNGYESVLNLTASADNLGHRFKCRVTNKYGDIEKPFLIMETLRPTRPSKIKIHSTFENEIQLQITWKNMNFPVNEIGIQYFIVTRKSEPKEADWKRSAYKALAPNNFYDYEGTKTDIFVTLPNLEGETVYWVRARASNDVGSSPWSYAIMASTVQEDPEDVPDGTTNSPEPVAAQANSDSTFYGVFFAGGILVIAVVCMFAMRLV